MSPWENNRTRLPQTFETRRGLDARRAAEGRPSGGRSYTGEARQSMMVKPNIIEWSSWARL
jgi:hypothetical protein